MLKNGSSKNILNHDNTNYFINTSQLYRLGMMVEQATDLSPEEEVNEFLERAINARSVEHLKREHVRPIFLKFKKMEFEKKVVILPS